MSSYENIKKLFFYMPVNFNLLKYNNLKMRLCMPPSERCRKAADCLRLYFNMQKPFIFKCKLLNAVVE